MSSTTTLPADINRGPEILAISGTLIGFATLTVLLRLWVRARIIQQLGWDDFFIAAATATMLAELGLIIPEVHYGAGRHAAYIVPASNVVVGLHYNFATQPLCLLGLCLAKVSVGLFLLRLTPSPRFRGVVWGVIVFTVLAAAGNFLTVFFQCTPLAFVWDTSIPGGKCIPAGNLKFAAFFNSSVSFLTDLIFALLPVPMLWSVQMKPKVKAAVACILALGIFASVSAVVKMTFLSSYGSHGDFLWDSADITIWTTVEICTAIIGASIPSLKPLVKAILFGTSVDAKSTGPAGYYMQKDSGASRSARSREAAFEMHSRRSAVARPGHVAVVSGGRRAGSGPNGSEEAILRQPEGIQKTMDVSVSVEDV